MSVKVVIVSLTTSNVVQNPMNSPWAKKDFQFNFQLSYQVNVSKV